MDRDSAQMTGLSGLGRGPTRPRPDLSILTDPTLVEDYSEIMKQIPHIKKDEDAQSFNASVVITPTENAHYEISGVSKLPGIQGEDHAPVIIEAETEGGVGEERRSHAADHDRNKVTDRSDASLRNDEADTSTGQVVEEDSEYAYSDSDFEDNLEERLRSLDESPESAAIETEGRVSAILARQKKGVANEDTGGLHSKGENESVQDEDDGDEDDGDEDDFKIGWNDDESDDSEEEYQPLHPPQELDPAKLYALYPFQGPDPSHCQLNQDESCTLLNDQDSYWWLVKRCTDGKIGFAPAELLETFPERLARLNCWKNENMSSQSVANKTSIDESDLEVKKSSQAPVLLDSHLQSYSKTNKSVSFNNVVSYAERYIDHADSLGQEHNEDQEAELSFSHVDEIHETELNDHILDDLSEVNSDAAFNLHDMAPLIIQKNRSKAAPTDTTTHNDKISDDLKQVFQAPIMPVAQSKESSQITNSNSNYSISTIGEYSPSSSDWTNDSPQLNNDNQFEEQKKDEVIPSIRAIQDITKLIDIPTDTSRIEQKKNKPLVNSYSALQHSDIIKDRIIATTGNIAASNATVVRTGSANNKSCYNNNNDNNNNNNDDNINLTLSAAASSSSSTCMDSEQRSPSTSEITLHTTALSEYHPSITTIYNPIFSKIDILMEKIEKSVL